MNKTQKEVQQAHLNAEKKTLNRLKKIYSQASKDCQQKIQELNSRTDMQNLQSIIYQKQYQEALKKQIDSILDSLQSDEFNTVADYLTECYENGYVGAMYDIQKQGIPVITPIDQKKVVKAVQTDSKLSTDMYTRLGEDVTKLKKTIRTELSRGTANGSTWLEMAEKIANGMNSPFKTSLNNAIRIARTEGHRIQQESAMDAMQSAKENGADVVKQWDATLDSRTRPDHQAADGQIRELDEYFRVGGEDLKAPGVGGSAKNVINCRCCVLQRARWALDEDELETLKKRASYFGLDKANSFKEYKEKYLNYTSMVYSEEGYLDILNSFKTDTLPDVFNFSKEKETALTKVYNEIDKRFMKDGYEHLALIDANTGKKMCSLTTNYSNKSVELSEEMKKIMNSSKDESVSIIHNHPRCNTFSPGDIVATNNNNAIKESIIINHNGEICFLSIPKNARMIIDTIEQAEDFADYYDDILNDIKSTGVSDKQARHMTVKRIAEEKGWYYGTKTIN